MITYYLIKWSEWCSLCDHNTDMYQVIKATSYKAMKRFPEVSNLHIMYIYDV